MPYLNKENYQLWTGPILNYYSPSFVFYIWTWIHASLKLTVAHPWPYQYRINRTILYGNHRFLSLNDGVSKSFRTGRLERELQVIHLSATRCSCIAILWASLVSFAAITFCVASQRVFIAVRVNFIMTQSGNFWILPHIFLDSCNLYDIYERIYCNFILCMK
jgi:hypothetical protein